MKMEQKFSLVYYPQGNGAIEAFNKTLVAIIRKMIEEKLIRWDNCLPLAFWAYRAIKHTTTKETPFSLVYGTETLWPVELNVPSTKMALGGTENSREFDLEILEDQRAQVQDRVRNYQRKITRAYNKLVRARNFQEGDLVLKAADHIMKGMHAAKFTPN